MKVKKVRVACLLFILPRGAPLAVFCNFQQTKPRDLMMRDDKIQADFDMVILPTAIVTRKPLNFVKSGNQATRTLEHLFRFNVRHT